MAAAAVERLNLNTGLVLWMVPRDIIYRQTKRALWNREHPYRQMLERASGRRVKMLEKDDPFNASDVENFLCVMLISLQSANRRTNKEFLKMFQDSGRYSSFFPENDNYLGDAPLRSRHPDLDPEDAEKPVLHSLSNVFKIQRPIIVLDEAHKAYGTQEDKFEQAINRLNPSLVIELSATPNRKRSNILVDVSGTDLKAEEMIKLPVRVESPENTDWQYILGLVHTRLEELTNEAMDLQHSEGRYIRPITVIRVERTGTDQRDGQHIHSEDVRQFLIQNLGVPAEAVAVQSTASHEITGVDLLSELSPIQWIITKAALMEGWDCSFAYVLVMLDNTKAEGAITQLIGRVLRQPDARRTGRGLLDQCYVCCMNLDVDTAVQHVKNGLEQQGLTGLDSEVRGTPGGKAESVPVNRREQFSEREIFLPKVLHTDGKEAWEELDYQRHIASVIDWNQIPVPDYQEGQAQNPQVSEATVDVNEEEVRTTVYDPRELHIDTSVNVAWYARRISDVMPNPFRAAKIVESVIQKEYDKGKTEDYIYRHRRSLAEQLRSHVAKWADKQAEQIFLSKLTEGEIRFDLETSDQNHRITKQPHEIMIFDDDRRLERRGRPVQFSLFEPVFEREFNRLERRFAFYLDEQKALHWWHRVGVRQQEEYFLRGWRRERIWPDFVAMAGECDGKPSLLIFETKGNNREGDDDTEYKRKVLAALEKSFNAGSMTVLDGPAKGAFRLVFDNEGFPDAGEALNQVRGNHHG